MKTSDEKCACRETIAACGYCGEHRGMRLYSTHDMEGKCYTLNRCLGCLAVSLSPRPSAQELARAYDCGYYGSGEEKFTGSMEKVLDMFRRRRARRLHRLLQGKGTVLDIGCGNGRFLSFLGTFGKYRLYGIERDGASAGRAMRIPSMSLKVGILEKNDFSDQSLDAVTLFHVFEHLEEPLAAMDIIQRILRPGGILILSFPNIGSYQASLFRGRWLHLDPPRHLFFFAPSDLRKLMEARGFDQVDEIHFHPDYNPFGFVQSTLNRLTGKREVLYEYLKGNRNHCDEFTIAFQMVFAGAIAPFALLADFFDSLCGRGATVELVFRKR